MSRAYSIWNKVTACVYQSEKSFGAKDNSNITINVGSGPQNSHEFVKIATVKDIQEKEIIFKFFIDGIKYKEMVFVNNKERAGELILTRHFLTSNI